MRKSLERGRQLVNVPDDPTPNSFGAAASGFLFTNIRNFTDKSDGSLPPMTCRSISQYAAFVAARGHLREPPCRELTIVNAADLRTH
jgi:hypothetical protein